MKLKYFLLLLVMVSVFAGFGYAQTDLVDLGIEMVFVEGGEFMMGCTPEQGKACRDDEKPAHRVRVSSFEIGKTEVTQAQWKAVMGNNSLSDFSGDKRPVERVSWGSCKQGYGWYCEKKYSVEEFIRRLNEMTGENYRLPTEAEWEYAARGGSMSEGYKYSGSNKSREAAWYGNSGRSTHDVCTKKPNELGLCDMSGNVGELVQDWYGDYSSEFQVDPDGRQLGSYHVQSYGFRGLANEYVWDTRVVRGGHFRGGTEDLRVSSRNHRTQRGGGINGPVGFRLARSR